MIRVPIDGIADHLPRAQALIIHVENCLTYLGRLESPQRYHNLWQAYIQAVRTLQQTISDFISSSLGLGRLSLHDYIRKARDTHLLPYPELKEYRRYCQIFPN